VLMQDCGVALLLVGKIGVDVSASNPERGGLYRSDNAGKMWELIDGHRVLHTRAWYYNHKA